MEKGWDKKRFEMWRSAVTRCYCTWSEAALFYLVTKTCYNGIWRLNEKGECNSSYCGQLNARGFFDEGWFTDVCLRVQDVEFTNMDYSLLLIRGWDYQIMHDKSTFIFLDTPYSRCKTTYNAIKWNDEDFIKLERNLQGAPYKWLMTINDNPFIREVFKDYEMVKHKVFYSCSQTPAGRGMKDELLIANYPIKDIAELVKSKLDAQEKTTTSRKPKKAMGRLDNAVDKRRRTRTPPVST